MGCNAGAALLRLFLWLNRVWRLHGSLGGCAGACVLAYGWAGVTKEIAVSYIEDMDKELVSSGNTAEARALVTGIAKKLVDTQQQDAVNRKYANAGALVVFFSAMTPRNEEGPLQGNLRVQVSDADAPTVKVSMDLNNVTICSVALSDSGPPVLTSPHLPNLAVAVYSLAEVARYVVALVPPDVATALINKLCLSRFLPDFRPFTWSDGDSYKSASVSMQTIKAEESSRA